MKFWLPERLIHRWASASKISKTHYSPHPLKIGTSLGEYRIEEVISETYSGYTYLANNRSIVIEEYFPNDIAIRGTDGTSLLLKDEENVVAYEKGLSQFLLLARVLSQIEHSGRVIHYQEENNTAWYASEAVVQASYADLLNTGKKLSEESLLSIFYAAIEYVFAPHNNGILHLDLGPKQILLLSEEEVILCGFNVTKSSGSSDIERGTPYYYAPEQLHLVGRLGPWSDLYSLGAILYHGLSKQSPPSAGRRYTNTQLGHEDPLIPAVKLGQGLYSQEFLELVDVMLMMSTGDRPTNAHQFLEEPSASGSLLDENVGNIAENSNYSLGVAANTAASSAELAVAALSNDSNTHRHTSTKVADALADAAKILEPADTTNRWTNQERNDSNVIEPVLRSSPKLASIGARALNDRHFWRQLLRRANPSKRAGDFIGRSVEDPMNIYPASKRKLKSRFNDTLYLNKKPIIWTAGLFIFLCTTLSGIWYWYQMEAAPDFQPTRIQIIQESGSLGSLTSQTEPIEGIIVTSLLQIQSYLDRGDLSSASNLLSLLRKNNIASDKLDKLYQQLILLEDKQRQTELRDNLSDEEQTLQQSAREKTVNNLLNQAVMAYGRGQLLSPIGSNALTLYRAALDLDRGNQRARNGINSIMYHYIEKTRDAIESGDFSKAEIYLRNVAAVDLQDPIINVLSKELKTRRLWSQREELRLANVAARKMEQEVAARKTMRANLSSGIKAYYKGNYLEAYSFLAPLAEVGIARAQFRVGAMLLHGRGVAQNKQTAKLWLNSALSAIQLAAARGEPWAQSDYGDYFADGVVLQKDYGQAVIWYRRAADQGYSPAQTNLGIMYMHGSGVTPDWDKAVDWFRIAASRGNYAAQENLRLLDISPIDAGG